MKKIVSALLAGVIAVSSAVFFAGCNEEEYPVQIANYTIEKEPENVVVLDPVTADIMAYMNYDRKLAGRSDAVSQPELAAAPVVGSENAPDVKAITDLKADLVFCGENLEKNVQEELESKGVQVIKLQTPETTAEVKTNYETIGKALGGKQKGSRAGKDSYAKLILDLEKQKRDIEGLSGTGALNTICYLYIENKKFANLASGNYGNILMGYTNCVNIFSVGHSEEMTSVNDDTAKVVANSNPNFIFYDDEATLKALQSNKTLSKLKAVTSKKTMRIPLKNMSLPGITAGKTVQAMIDFIYKGKVTTPDEATVPPTTAPGKKAEDKKAEDKKTETKAAETKPAETKAEETKAAEAANAEESKDLSADYKINLESLTLKKSNSNDNVKIMQQRLFDLGYIKQQGSDTNITGYYGDVTETAVKAFQKQNGIKESGEADNDTLKLLFSSAAKKAE